MQLADNTTTIMHRMLAATARARLQWLHPGRALKRGGSIAPHNPSTVYPMPRPLLLPKLQAADICRGVWVLAGHEIHAGGNIIFDHHEAPQDWLCELHSFGWIFSLLDGGQRLWLLRARTLLLDWLERARQRRLPPEAQQSQVAAMRLIHCTAAASAMLANADDRFRHQFMQGLMLMHRHVLRPLPRGASATDRLMVLLARVWAVLALGNDMHAREQALQALSEEMQRQFLPDGGHISRSPACLLKLLGLLLPLQQAVEQTGMAVPVAMQQIVERALPMLRMLRHADGGLALFHGGREELQRETALLLQHDDIAGAPLHLAPQSGYARLAQADSVVIVDVGTLPDALANARGALSPLALEFSAHGRRIITSCGFPLPADDVLDAAARRSAAHSMPVLNDEDAGILREMGVLSWLGHTPQSGGSPPQAEMTSTKHGMLLEASHDAWARTHGMRTSRCLFLSADGHDLRGEDAFTPLDEGSAAGEMPFTMRFHLHPGVRATLSRDGNSVMLVLPDRSSWRFVARNAQLSLEESILLAGRNGPRRSTQIVLAGICPAQGWRINWRLYRHSTPARRKRRKDKDLPALPLQD